MALRLHRIVLYRNKRAVSKRSERRIVERRFSCIVICGTQGRVSDVRACWIVSLRFRGQVQSGDVRIVAGLRERCEMRRGEQSIVLK